MPLASHRIRYVVLAVVLTWMALMLLTRPAHGAWSADPVEVHATTALCPAVSVVGDGHFGAIVVWQENSATGGTLNAQHLLANGDLDPAWGGPAAVSDRDAARVALGAVSDGAGGAYVWWMEAMALHITRITADGAVGTGWPTQGRVLGTLLSTTARPVLLADGSGGVYAAWMAMGSLLPFTTAIVRALHLGPDNVAKGGWPAAGRTLATAAGSFGIATAAGGGLWLAYATTPADDQGYQPGEIRVTRLTASGAASAGWSAGGVTLAPWRGDLLAYDPYDWGYAPNMRLNAAEDDGAGGAFVMFGVAEDSGTPGIGPSVCYRMQRVDANGGIRPGWPAEGVVTGTVAGLCAWNGRSADISLRLHGDQHGGVFVGAPEFFDHGTGFSFVHYSGSGARVGDYFSIGASGLESAARGDGGVVAASFFPTGPYGPYSPDAYLNVMQSAPGGYFFEDHPEPVQDWYGDIGLAATGDGGAIFAWSQERERFGVFAIRLGPAGPVTGVTPTPVIGPPSLRARFVRGEGVHAVASFSGSPRLRLALYDLAGRRVVSVSSDATLGADVVFPGTRDLPGGIYFARASDGARVLNARVLVLP